MTPLGLSAPLPPAAKAPASASGSSPAKGGGEFARTLHAASAPADGEAPEAAAAKMPAEREPGADEQPGIPADPSLVPTPEPVTTLPWPPEGLAGLPGIVMPADADADTDAEPQSVPSTTLRGGLQTLAGAMAAPAASSTALSPAAQPLAAAAAQEPGLAASLDDGAAAMPLPVELQTAGDAAPAPPAFALPAVAGGAPLALREPPPVLATPLPPADVHAEDFGDRFGAQLQWMAGQKIGHARIQVTPHGLGPVEVRLQLDGDRISAEFFSAHVDTRQALEQGLPRLRDLLGEHGFHLAHADVGAQSGGDDRGGDPRAAAPADGAGNEPATVAAVTSAVSYGGSGLLDAYA